MELRQPDRALPARPIFGWRAFWARPEPPTVRTSLAAVLIALALALWPAPATAKATSIICVQQGLAALGFDPGVVTGTIGPATRVAADALASARALPIGDLTGETSTLWCFLLMSFVVDARLATAAEWLERAAQILEPLPAAPWAELLAARIDDARTAERGDPVRATFEGNPWVVMTHTYAICDYVPANTGHSYRDFAHVEAEVTFCSSFLSKSEHAQVQAVLHEFFHVINGMGECGPIWFEYWVSFLATNTYSPADFDWQQNDCGDPRALPPAVTPGATVIFSAP